MKMETTNQYQHIVDHVSSFHAASLKLRILFERIMRKERKQ
jgi:hypothetical protein